MVAVPTNPKAAGDKMMRLLFAVVLCFLGLCPLETQADVVFDDWFEARTLRLDLIFEGNSENQHISLDEMMSENAWAGRKGHLDSLCLKGNGQVLVKDSATQQTIYATSFSSLFQEWQHTPEALTKTRAFEQCFLVPMPKKAVTVEVRLLDSWQKETSRLVFPVSPQDVLIRNLDANTARIPFRTVLKNGDVSRCLDLAFVAEGYKKEEMDLFYQDVDKVCAQLFAHEPYTRLKNRFNVYAVASPSVDSGASEPGEGRWKQTALGSSFNTFYIDRYLTTLHVKRLFDVLIGVPFDQIIILVNTDKYGGGGIFNLYMLSSAHHKYSLPVCVHEFGHSFAGLADEYDHEDGSSEYYHKGVEPWEPNITTLADFKSKWEDLMPRNYGIPTPKSDDKKTQYTKVGLFEGAGYISKGVYRPAQECRMKINDVPAFCPVCQRAIERIINFYTE